MESFRGWELPLGVDESFRLKKPKESDRDNSEGSVYLILAIWKDNMLCLRKGRNCGRVRGACGLRRMSSAFQKVDSGEVKPFNHIEMKNCGYRNEIMKKNTRPIQRDLSTLI